MEEQQQLPEHEDFEVTTTKQPAGLYRLFFAEMWERFSYYGMRALLVLYMVRQLLYSDGEAAHVYGAYGALVYATPLIGGYFADKVLGYRKAIMLGAVLMTIGHFVMAIEQELFFYGAMAFIIIGNGFFKPNISSMVGTLYKGEHDPRRDKGFTIFYMGINLGALLAPLIAGLVGETFGWHYGFGLAGLGMLAGLITFASGQSVFGGRGLPPDEKLFKKWSIPVYAGSFLIVPLIGLLVWQNEAMNFIMMLVGAFVLVALFTIALREEPVQRDRVFVILILIFFATIFWSFFEQAGSSITLFTDRNVIRHGIPTSSFQAVNPTFIVMLAPVFSWMWFMLGRRNLEPNTPVKFALGIIQLGLGFGVFVLGAMFAEGGQVILLFLVLGYLLHTTGELCLSPIGLSMVTKLSPGKVVALVMGCWFLSSSFAHYLGGAIASLTATPGEQVYVASYIPAEEDIESGKRTLRAFQSSDEFGLLAYTETTGEGDDARPKDPIKVTVQIQKAGAPVPALHRIRSYEAVSPDEPTDVSLVSKTLDPNNEFSTYQVLGSPKHGQLKGEDGPERTYVPDASGFERDTVRYQICDKRREGICDTLELVLTNQAKVDLNGPIIPERQVTYKIDTTEKILAFGLHKKEEYKTSIQALNLGYHPEGEQVKLKPDPDNPPKHGILNVNTANDSRISKKRSLVQYSSVFSVIFYIAAGSGVLLLLISGWIKKMMHGVK